MRVNGRGWKGGGGVRDVSEFGSFRRPVLIMFLPLPQPSLPPRRTPLEVRVEEWAGASFCRDMV